MNSPATTSPAATGSTAASPSPHATYEPAERFVQLDVHGMTCTSCAARIEKKLNKIGGVVATVNYATEKATVSFDQPVTTQDLVDTVSRTGYQATPSPTTRPHPTADGGPDHEPAEPDELRTLRRRLVLSAVSTTPVIALAMVPALQFSGWQWISLVLAWPVVAWAAWPFHRAAAINLRHGAATMDTLISIGVLAAFVWSVVALLIGPAGHIGMQHAFEFTLQRSDGLGNIYLEAATGVTTFLLAGRYFEARSKSTAGAALRALLQLGATEVTVLRDRDGTPTEERTGVDDLTVGMRFVVRPGEKIATDGVIETGRAALDTAVITGEPVPVEVGPGHSITGGTVNTDGRLVVRATRVGADTQLAQIARLVEQAQTGKARVQRLADRISGVFVPTVITMAVATLAFWLGSGAGPAFAFTTGVAVLIIACPCTLGLATPIALMVGTGRGAQLGVLIRGPQVLEATRSVDTVVLDKTGTVTTGVMAVTDLVVADGGDPVELIMVAGAAEAGSEHPIARAITRHAEHQSQAPLPQASAFGSTAGLGIRATISWSGAEHEVTVGRPSLLSEHGLIADQVVDAATTTSSATAVQVGWDGRVRGVIMVADQIAEHAREAVDGLRALGLTPILLTGDRESVAHEVAAELEIADVIADVLPAQKQGEIQRLQAEGRTVAMIGDGVNDAAALASADLGLAMGTGADAAIEASDLTLVSGDLRSAVTAIRLSRSTLATIKGNLFWAFAYNLAALPLAALGFLTPMFAGAAMAFSSVFVVANSLRLRRFHG